MGGIKKAFEYLNNLKPITSWFSEHFSPKNTEKIDKKNERMFYTRENASFFDSIRINLDNLLKNKTINKKEFNFVLASLLFQASYHSNTSGVFKGFHNGWGGKTKTALYRIKGKAFLIKPILYYSKQKCKVYRKDANVLIKKLKNIKILYLDPPYNQHPYAANYHVLNTITLNDKPKEITKYITKGKKSAIRDDWKINRRSKFNYKSTASKSFDNILKYSDAEYILISYSTDGIIPIKDIIEISAKYGFLEIFFQEYKRYVVGNTRKSKKLKNIEFVIRINTQQKSSKNCKIKHKKILKIEERLNV